jgi:pimeloyl-ACP methyl ester carboxylesterase
MSILSLVFEKEKPMSKVPLRDLIVVLPGITGSVLQRDGRDLWNISGQAFWEFLTSLGDGLQFLRVRDNGAEDGIRATSLISGIHLIPGLVKIDGYADLIAMIMKHFTATRGDIHQPTAQANLFPFPYDWRHDNRDAAHQLKRFLDRQLPLWREQSYEEHAKVVLIAHSMGGLIARYYLEVLSGWRDCRALITFGTPYRGSLDALGYLANGYKKLFLDLTDVVRSFPSVYQLLPIYRVVEQQGTYHRVAELAGLPKVDQGRAQEALAFHREIEEAVTLHQRDPVYLDQGYKILPVVGTRQPTYQSSTVVHDRLTLSRDLPAEIDQLLADGDGTVPRASAIPIELSDAYYDTFVPEQHGSLQSNAAMLLQLVERLKQMQVRGMQAIRGPESRPDASVQPAIALELDDLYVQGSEPVELRANLLNIPHLQGELQATIQVVGGSTMALETRPFRQEGQGWVLAANDLPVGSYRVTVSLAHGGVYTPPPVHGLFEIAP